MKEALMLVTLASILGCLGWSLTDRDVNDATATELSDRALAAAERGDLPAVRQLLTELQTNRRDTNAMGPLGQAIIHRRIELVQILMDGGADVNAVYIGGVTPLMLACSIGDLDVVNLLLDCGAFVNRQSNHGTSALMVAAGIDSPAIIRRLLEANADPSLRTVTQETALDVAVMDSPGSLSQRLLEEATFDPSATTASGNLQ